MIWLLTVCLEVFCVLCDGRHTRLPMIYPPQHSPPYPPSYPPPEPKAPPPIHVSTTLYDMETKYQQSMLDKHNKYRTDHHVQPLVWDKSLEYMAMTWAENMCKLHLWEHSSFDYGENIGSTQNPNVVDMWYNEYMVYDYKNPSFNAGHFTQVVWKGSRRLGCAYVELDSNGEPCMLWIGTRLRQITPHVCEYDPPGNYISDFKNNVFPA